MGWGGEWKGVWRRESSNEKNEGRWEGECHELPDTEETVHCYAELVPTLYSPLARLSLTPVGLL